MDGALELHATDVSSDPTDGGFNALEGVEPQPHTLTHFRLLDTLRLAALRREIEYSDGKAAAAAAPNFRRSVECGAIGGSRSFVAVGLRTRVHTSKFLIDRNSQRPHDRPAAGLQWAVCKPTYARDIGELLSIRPERGERGSDHIWQECLKGSGQVLPPLRPSRWCPPAQCGQHAFGLASLTYGETLPAAPIVILGRPFAHPWRMDKPPRAPVFVT